MESMLYEIIGRLFVENISLKEQGRQVGALVQSLTGKVAEYEQRSAQVGERSPMGDGAPLAGAGE